MPFVKVGGYFIPYKSGDMEEELAQAKKAVAILGGEIEDVTGFELPGGEGSRSLIKIRKMKPISAKYPRKAGSLEKNHLDQNKHENGYMQN